MAHYFAEEDFFCPVCRDIFKYPVLLPCSHSVCKECVKMCWKSKSFRQCPVCRKRLVASDPPINMALKNLCDVVFEKRSQGSSPAPEHYCMLHFEKLKLFCVDDLQPVCLVCRDSSKHTNHKFSPIDEAVKDRKGELQSALTALQAKLKTFKNYKQKWSPAAEHIKFQTQHTEHQIKQQFEQLHQFLRDEEAVRIAALREEGDQKSRMIKEKIEELNRDISSLSDAIKAIEKEMGAENIPFLQNYKATVERAQCTLQDPEELSGAPINVAKHLSNLKFSVWEKMQETAQYKSHSLVGSSETPVDQGEAGLGPKRAVVL